MPVTISIITYCPTSRSIILTLLKMSDLYASRWFIAGVAMILRQSVLVPEGQAGVPLSVVSFRHSTTEERV